MTTLRIVGAGALAALLVSSMSFAGPAPAKAEEAKTEKRGFWEWDPAERRDPFEYRSPEKVTETVDVPVARPTIDILNPTKTSVKTPVKLPTKSAASIQQARDFADAKVQEAKYFLGMQQYARASESIQEAMNRMKGIRMADPLLTERLDRVYATAERLKTRAEIEREFKGISIDIQGIIWEPTNPVALIKGKSVREGDVVEGALVEEIRTSEIIFNFKGVRCRRKPGR